MKEKIGINNSKSNIISFQKYKDTKNEMVTSTIAAIIAIKVDHPKQFTPQDFFVNEIDSFENIEILAFEDAMDNDGIGLTTIDAQNDSSNDA